LGKSDSYSYSKTLESIQVDQPFREAGIPVFGSFVNDILIPPFEYEKNQCWELPATKTPEGHFFIRFFKHTKIGKIKTRENPSVHSNRSQKPLRALRH
jgi:hypothetical protein